MRKSAKKWCISLLCFTIGIMIALASIVVFIDPYFHYHKPATDLFFYPLNNQRSQNNGIVKNFEYDAIITGTSMAENFRTSEMNRLFGVYAIKVPFSGGTYKEINDTLSVALKSNSNIVMVVRTLDIAYLIEDKDLMRVDLGVYPTYLYDDYLANDVKYILNKSMLSRSWSIVKNAVEGAEGGVTDFDAYSSWNADYSFGKAEVLKYIDKFNQPSKIYPLEEKEKKIVCENIAQNVTELAKNYPDTKFYYFFTPYSIAWWGEQYQAGNISRQVEAERCAIELILECDNIYLFSFNDNFDITTNLDNYKDITHYGEWINSYILECMKEGTNRLTKDNYIEYLEREHDFYSNFDYTTLFE